MIAVIKQGTEQKQVDNLIRWLASQGVATHISNGEYQTVLGLVGDTSKIDIELLENLEFVDKVTRISEPFKSANRKFHPDDTVIDVNGIKIGGGHFAFIAGPCSVESEEQIVAIARRVKAAGASFLRGGAF
ncbi:MAG: 3-deoxy-7-phosphoheptulonate synthase, partial [Clostridia bacterium]|nr:3-deoxy-7-phosphoheptulonate synthase [Clostridia bacterium]